MAQRDTTMVPVTLDRQRMYRLNDTDRAAISVGPGEVEVPRWVAQAWGIAPSTPQQQSALRAAILAASDEELIAIPGIGPASVESLRTWAAETQVSSAEPQGEPTAPPSEPVDESGSDALPAAIGDAQQAAEDAPNAPDEKVAATGEQPLEVNEPAASEATEAGQRTASTRSARRG